MKNDLMAEGFVKFQDKISQLNLKSDKRLKVKTPAFGQGFQMS